MGIHVLTHLAVARIACPRAIEHTSWIPFRLRLKFDQTPSTLTFRVIGLAPLLAGGVAAVVATQTGIWRRIKGADPYYLHHLAVVYWLLYAVPSPVDLQLALRPSTQTIPDVRPGPR